MDSHVSAYRWIIAWAVLGLLLFAFGKLAFGRTIIYYLAVLMLLLLVLTQYQEVVSLLSPFSQLGQGGNNG